MAGGSESRRSMASASVAAHRAEANVADARLARYNDRIGRILKNAVYVSLGNLGRTIPIVLLSVLPFAMVLINWALASIVLLCGFSVSAYLQAKLYKKVFERLEAVSGTVPEAIEA